MRSVRTRAALEDVLAPLPVELLAELGAEQAEDPAAGLAAFGEILDERRRDQLVDLVVGVVLTLQRRQDVADPGEVRLLAGADHSVSRSISSPMNTWGRSSS